MKKIAIRKLNRTQLKKEGTKEIYLTGKYLLDFFGYEQMEELATSRKDPEAKKVFYRKSDYFYQDEPASFILNVTKENNEVRLTGFYEHLPEDIKETDEIVLEAIELESGENIFLFDVIKKTNLMVLQKLSINDDVDNYTIGQNAKGIIQFTPKKDAALNNENAYWFWDDRVSKQKFDEYAKKSIEAILSFKGKIKTQNIRIMPTHIKIKKLLKALSNSNNSVKAQDKELYIIEEETDAGWRTITDIGANLLELSLEEGKLIISDRNNNSFVYYGGGKI